ncbi:MAG: tetratricopeptide repeat protein [Bacteroidales bacterium]|nr:tetratricopeptide repeat protein [Bacteroidales bacterium]
MKSRHKLGLMLGMVFIITISASAQKHIENYDPEALFNEGVLLFQNQEYGAALSTFSQYRAQVADAKSQRCVDAQYYEAVSSLYLGHADGPAKIMQFVNDNPGSTWARHANFLYANNLFQNKKYKEALAIYEKTDGMSLTTDEAQQMQFNMGYAYFQSGDLDKAMPLFHGLMMNEGKYQDAARYYYAHIQYVKEKYTEALDNFRRLRTHKDYASVVPSYIMQIDYLKGDYQSVIEEGPEYIRKADKKRKAEMAQIVADAYFQQKDYDKALEYYQIYTKNLTRGMSRQAYYQMGVSKMMKGNYKAAISDLQKVAGNNDILAQYASYYLASCYAKTDEPKYARSAFYNAYSAGFDKELAEEALFDYARLSLIPGADPFNEAVGLLDNFLAEHPNSERKAEAEEMAIYLLLNAKENDEALERLEAMKNKSKELQTVYNDLLYATGIDNFQKGYYDKAQVYFSKVMNTKQSAANKAEACFWMGESAYQMGDYTKAGKYLTQFKGMNAASSLPEYSLADYDLGYIYYQKPDYDAAAERFRSFIRLADDRQQNDLKTDAYIRLGDCFFMERSYDKAINYYDLATRVGKRNADYALYQQSLCYGAKGNANQKITMLNDMLEAYPSTPYYEQALFEIGNTYLVHGDKRSAIASFHCLIKDRPRSSYTRPAMMKVGMIYYNNNQYDQALTNLKNLVASYPNTDESREALSIIRSIYMEQNNLDEYFGYVNANGGQVKVTQQDSLAFANAEGFYLDGQYQKAQTALQYYFDNFSRGAYLLKAHYYAYECAERVGTEDQVITHLNYILSQPDNDYTDNALLKMARIEYEKGNYKKAGEYYERLSRITEEPLKRLEALEGSMKSNFFMGNYDKAIEMGESLRQSRDLTDDQVNQINHIVGKSYYEKGNYSAAIEKLDKSARNDKSVYGAESAYYSAMASIKLKQYDEAENKVFDISDNFSKYDYWVAKSFIALADVYVAKENYFQAKETLRSVIDNYKGNDLKQEARAKLAEVERKEPKVSNSNGIEPIEPE